MWQGGGRELRAAGYFLVLAAAGGFGWLLLTHRGAADPGWEAVLLSALAGAAVGLGARLLRQSHPGRGAPGRRANPPAGVEPSARGTAASPPLLIVYEPPSEVSEDEAAQLEETLLLLCKQDRPLFQRLLDYERRRQPDLSRAGLLREAIGRFRRDNR